MHKRSVMWPCGVCVSVWLVGWYVRVLYWNHRDTNKITIPKNCWHFERRAAIGHVTVRHCITRTVNKFLILFKHDNFQQYFVRMREIILNCCYILMLSSSWSLRSNSKRYLWGTTYLRTPFLGMIAVVTLFVKGAEVVDPTNSTAARSWSSIHEVSKNISIRRS